MTEPSALSVFDTFWMLDTVPGQADGSVLRVLDAVTAVDLSSIGSKKDVVGTLVQEHQIDNGIAQWLASGMKRNKNAEDNGGPPFDWGFNVDTVLGLVPCFANQNFVELVEQATMDGNKTVHLVRGGSNAAWGRDPTILPKLDKLQKQIPSFHVHVLPKAGHWVHTDDLPGLIKVLEQNSRLTK